MVITWACFWQGWDGSLDISESGSKVSYMLSTTSLFLKNSRSELPLFLKWEWLPAQIPHLPFHRVQFCPLIRFAPWRLWTLMFHSVSLCHCELGKEFSSSKSTTCNFLHYFQISGAVDNAAFLIISLADSSTLRPLLPCWKHPNIQFVLHRNMYSTQILHQTKFSVFQQLLTVSGI